MQITLLVHTRDSYEQMQYNVSFLFWLYTIIPCVIIIIEQTIAPN